jgi:hypothetical protein
MESLVAEGRTVWDAPGKRRAARGSSAIERASMDLDA